jgi:hypothetical protein
MGHRRERWPASTGFHVAFLMAFPVVVERARSSVHLGPNPQGSILPPSERGCRLGRHPRSFFAIDTGCRTWARHRVAACGPRSQPSEAARRRKRVRVFTGGLLGQVDRRSDPRIGRESANRLPLAADRVWKWPTSRRGSRRRVRRRIFGQVGQAPGRVAWGAHVGGIGRARAVADVRSMRRTKRFGAFGGSRRQTDRPLALGATAGPG